MTDPVVELPVGGAFQLDVLNLVRDGQPAEPAALADGVSVTSGRTALALVAEELGSGGWLLPAYLCGSVLQPLREAGRPVSFYGVGADLRPRVDELETLLAAHRPRALLVVDYFGFPPEETAAIAAAAASAGAATVEDCVHGSLLELPEPAGGRLGDIVFTSFRKYLPVPDGGLLRGVAPRELLPAGGEAVQKRLLGQLLRALSGPLPASDRESVFLDLLAEGEAALEAEIPLRSTSIVSRTLLARLDLAAAASRRRANYATLLEAIGDWAAFGVLPLRTRLPEGVSPLVLPVRIPGGRRDAVRAGLAARRIFCPVNWHLPAEIDPVRFPEEHALSREILGLPIDQRYGPDEVARIAEAALEVVQDLA